MLYHQCLSSVVDDHLDVQDSSAKCSRNLRAPAYFTSRVLRKMREQIVFSSIVGSRGSERSFWSMFSIFLTTRPSVNSSKPFTADAVGRTQPPEAELLLVSAESIADTQVTLSLIILRAAIGTKLSDLQGVVLTFWPHANTNVFHRVFQEINTARESLRCWTVTNMSSSVARLAHHAHRGACIHTSASIPD